MHEKSTSPCRMVQQTYPAGVTGQDIFAWKPELLSSTVAAKVDQDHLWI